MPNVFRPTNDQQLNNVANAIIALDPAGEITAEVLRATLDQLYDGQHTGRYSWAQLHKTEKTHCGTLVEINLQRRFNFADGAGLDYSIAGVDVDCKYSQTLGNWMIPPEAYNQLLLLLWADDTRSLWSMGIIRATPASLTTGTNRDLKATLNANGRQAVSWIFHNDPLPPNILLQLPPQTVHNIMTQPSGQAKVNELFRSALEMRVGRGVVATVAMQDDYMKRVRANGGARTALRAEGIAILGQYSNHVRVAQQLGVPVPGKGESVAVRLAPAAGPGNGIAVINGTFWQRTQAQNVNVPAPDIPKA